MSNADAPRYATAMICIDGRIQQAVRDWVLDTYAIDFLDVISHPGMDAFLARSGPVDRLLTNLDLSYRQHGARIAFVVGHEGCSGNGVSDSQHQSDIRQAIDRLHMFRPLFRIVGLWVPRAGSVTSVDERLPA